MNSDIVLALLVAVLGGAGASLITGWLARPKTRADAQALNVSAEVALSSDAREWVKNAMDRASVAERQAEAAVARADAADERNDAADARIAKLEKESGEYRTVIRLLIEYTHRLRQDIIASGGAPPEPPGNLRLDIARPDL